MQWGFDSLGLIMAMEHVSLGSCPTLDKIWFWKESRQVRSRFR